MSLSCILVVDVLKKYSVNEISKMCSSEKKEKKKKKSLDIIYYYFYYEHICDPGPQNQS